MTVDVSWETVSDGRTEQGAGFKDQMKALLAGGETLAITLPDGSVKTFDDVASFSAWFDALAT
ncbi:MAG: hypothetical protein ACKO1H_08215 [Tabrizicola sp.]